MEYPFHIYSSHFQFFILDKDSPFDTDKDYFWTDEAVNARLAIGTNVLGIGTSCYSDVKGKLLILNEENTSDNFSQYDHIVEGSIDLPSGVLEIQTCDSASTELSINLTSQTYNIRIYSSNLDSVINEEGDDFYTIEIWPGDKIERKVLKQYVI